MIQETSKSAYIPKFAKATTQFFFFLCFLSNNFQSLESRNELTCIIPSILETNLLQPTGPAQRPVPGSNLNWEPMTLTFLQRQTQKGSRRGPRHPQTCKTLFLFLFFFKEEEEEAVPIIKLNLQLLQNLENFASAL